LPFFIIVHNSYNFCGPRTETDFNQIMSKSCPTVQQIIFFTWNNAFKIFKEKNHHAWMPQSRNRRSFQEWICIVTIVVWCFCMWLA